MHKKLSKILLSSIAILTMLSQPIFAETKNIERIAGPNRIETSILSAKKVDSKILVIANSRSFADSLSAYNLVKNFHAKFIIIDNSTNIQDYLQNIEEVYIVGGTDSISENIENDIKNHTKVTRVSGNNRYETNKETLDLAHYDHVAMADGRDYPDALSASGLLANKDLGLLLVDGSKKINPYFHVVYTIGGYKSIKDTLGRRIAGKDRFETSRLVNKEFFQDKYVITYGYHFADALSAINFIHDGHTAISLVGKTLDKELSNDLKHITNIVIVGGKVSNTIEKDIRNKSITQTTKPVISGKIKNKDQYRRLMYNSLKSSKLLKKVEFDKSISLDQFNNILADPLIKEFAYSSNVSYENIDNLDYIEKVLYITPHNCFTDIEYHIINQDEYSKYINDLNIIIDKLDLRNKSGEDLIKTWVNYLRETTVYDHESIDSDGRVKAIRPFLFNSVLKYKMGVCYSFSTTTCDMLRQLDLPAYLVLCNNGRHVYTKAYMNGRWYEFDPTTKYGDKSLMINPEYNREMEKFLESL